MLISFLFTSLLFTAICKASPDSNFAFLHLFSMRMVLIPVSCTMSRTSVHRWFQKLPHLHSGRHLYYSQHLENSKGFGNNETAIADEEQICRRNIFCSSEWPNTYVLEITISQMFLFYFFLDNSYFCWGYLHFCPLEILVYNFLYL